MKKNNKGFTLIELLAVIVILAIILAVTIPSVINSLDKARENSLQNAADSVADWFAKNYELDAMGGFAGGADAAYRAFLDNNNATTLIDSSQKDFDKDKSPWNLTADVLTSAGISNAAANIKIYSNEQGADNNNVSTVYYNKSKNRVCVKLTAQANGSFFNNKDTSTDGKKNQKFSSGC